jgi:hypothetical protein
MAGDSCGLTGTTTIRRDRLDSHHFAAHLRGCFGTVIDWTVIIGVDDVPLRLADLLAGFSIVVDLGYGLPMETAMRSCVLGTALARRLGLPDRKVAEVFYVSLLLHVGCLAYSHETNAWFGDDAALRRAVVRSNSFSETAKILIPEGTRDLPPTARLKKAALLAATGPRFSNRRDLASCETARAVARRIGLPSAISDALLDVHEWWNGRGARQLKGETIAASARIARVATDAVFLAALREPDAVAITLSSLCGQTPGHVGGTTTRRRFGWLAQVDASSSMDGN